MHSISSLDDLSLWKDFCFILYFYNFFSLFFAKMKFLFYVSSLIGSSVYAFIFCCPKPLLFVRESKDRFSLYSSRITRFVLPFWYTKGMEALKLAIGQIVLSIISQYIEQCLFRRLDICFFIYWQFFVTAVFVRTLLDCISSIRMYLILNVTLSFCRSLSLVICRVGPSQDFVWIFGSLKALS